MVKSKVHINAASSLIQVIISSIIIFISYKYLINILGVEKLGVWSLIVASVSILNIGNLGLSSTIVKYIAKYLVHNVREKISSIIQTALITVLIISVLLLGIVFILANILLKAIVPENQIALALSLLPYSLINLGIILQAGISLSALDGAQKYYIKNMILIFSSLVFILLIFLFVPKFDLLGVVYAQIFQSVLTLSLAWLMLKKTFPYLPLFPYQWSKSTLVEIIGYGTNLQLITILQMLYEPVTKSVLTIFGGLAAVGYYEMANRLVLKTREMILSMFQVLIPVYASQIENDYEKIKSTYSKSINYLLFLAIPIFALLVIATPLISVFLIGSFEEQFYIFVIILLCSWFINIINAPAYFAFLGIGLLRWNVLSHLTVGVLNLVLCYIFGFYFGGAGTVLGWALALSLGSLIISFKFNSLQKISLYEIVNRENKILFLVSIFTIIILILVKILYSTLSYNLFANALFILVYILMSFYFIWNHSIRRDLFNSLKLLFSFK